MFVLKRALNSVRLETLRAKILVFAVLPTAILLSVLITLEVRMLYREMRESSLLRIDLGTAQAAAEIDRGNLEGITVARMVAAAQENGLLGRREESIRFARKVLETHPQFTGLSIGYEPNADGRRQARRHGRCVNSTNRRANSRRPSAACAKNSHASRPATRSLSRRVDTRLFAAGFPRFPPSLEVACSSAS